MNDVTMSKICQLKDMDISKRLLPDSIQYNKSNFSHENELVLKNFSCPLVHWFVRYRYLIHLHKMCRL